MIILHLHLQPQFKMNYFIYTSHHYNVSQTAAALSSSLSMCRHREPRLTTAHSTSAHQSSKQIRALDAERENKNNNKQAARNSRFLWYPCHWWTGSKRLVQYKRRNAQKTKHWKTSSTVMIFTQGREPGRMIEAPVTKCDSGTQTDTHFMESNIVKSYEWNEWELRRKALKLVSDHKLYFSIPRAWWKQLSKQNLNLNLGKAILVVWVGFVHFREDQLLY